jgi:hypothetical protein
VTSKWLTLVAVVALVGCETGGSADSSQPSTTTPTVAPVTSTSTSSTSTTLLVPPLVLFPDGLGLVSFGDPVDDVLATLTGLFGTPTQDDLYESPFDVPAGWQGDDRGPDACFVGTGTGYTCFDYLRFVDWDEIGLFLVFSDLGTNPDVDPSDNDYFVQIPPSFQGYDYSWGEGGPLLYTADGITTGSTVTELLGLGDRIEFAWTECGELVDFVIADPGTADGGYIWGTLDDYDYEGFQTSGLPRDNATVQYLHAGAGGSC